MLKFCLNGDATYIMGKIKAKDNLNIANLMQTFENVQYQSIKKSPPQCYGSLLGNRLVNLGISKQQHLYLRTNNLI